MGTAFAAGAGARVPLWWSEVMLLSTAETWRLNVFPSRSTYENVFELVPFPLLPVDAMWKKPANTGGREG